MASYCYSESNAFHLKRVCRMVQLLWHGVLVLSASCKRSINAAIEHDIDIVAVK